jgi:hypothetical protein
MPLAEFEPTIPVFKRAKTFHASDPAATVTGTLLFYSGKLNKVEDKKQYKLLTPWLRVPLDKLISG